MVGFLWFVYGLVGCVWVLFFFVCVVFLVCFVILNIVAGDIVPLTWVVALEPNLVHHAFSRTSTTHTVVRRVAAACSGTPELVWK